MSQAMLNSLLLIIVSTALGIVTTWFWRSRQAVVEKAKTLADENAKLMHRVSDVEMKLALVNQAVIPISTAFQAILIKELTHFHTPEMDALMEKIGPPNTMTPEEQTRLSILLEERTRDMGPEISESEREAAAILPAVIKRALVEAETIDHAEKLKLKLVAVAAIVGVPNAVPENAAAESLKKIEENTGATANALTALNKRATDKLATTAHTKGRDEL